MVDEHGFFLNVTKAANNVIKVQRRRFKFLAERTLQGGAHQTTLNIELFNNQCF
jgi:hypothetical protein